MALFDMVPPSEDSGEPGFDQLSIARTHDYWLGGSHHDDADRKYADHISVCAPYVPYIVRAQRTLLGRMVRYLLDKGVRQFVDLGSGIPAVGHVHEIAHAVDPAARVVYVDTDPRVLDDSRELLAGKDNVVLLDADLRKPAQVLDDPGLRRLIDLSEPLAVLVISTLQHIPDSDDPVAVIAGYTDAMCPGSYLAVAHYGPDDRLRAAYDLFDTMRLGQRPNVSLRDQASLTVLFAGLELIEPGIVPLALWRPDPDDDLGLNPERQPIYAALGRKP